MVHWPAQSSSSPLGVRTIHKTTPAMIPKGQRPSWGKDLGLIPPPALMFFLINSFVWGNSLFRFFQIRWMVIGGHLVSVGKAENGKISFIRIVVGTPVFSAKMPVAGILLSHMGDPGFGQDGQGLLERKIDVPLPYTRPLVEDEENKQIILKAHQKQGSGQFLFLHFLENGIGWCQLLGLGLKFLQGLADIAESRLPPSEQEPKDES